MMRGKNYGRGRGRVVRRGVDPKGLLPSANAQRPDLFDTRRDDYDTDDSDDEDDEDGDDAQRPNVFDDRRDN